MLTPVERSHCIIGLFCCVLRSSMKVAKGVGLIFQLVILGRVAAKNLELFR